MVQIRAFNWFLYQYGTKGWNVCSICAYTWTIREICTTDGNKKSMQRYFRDATLSLMGAMKSKESPTPNSANSCTRVQHTCIPA